MIGIYKITSPSKRVYIGQSWNIEGRVRSYKNKACKTQTLLYHSICKYTWGNHLFEVIKELKEDITQEYLDTLEINYINYYKKQGCSLNLKEGGSNGKHSEISKLKMKQSQLLSHKNKPSRVVNKRKIYQYKLIGTFIKEWESITEASSNLNISIACISMHLRKKSSMACGYIFSYEKLDTCPYNGKYNRKDL